MAGELAAALPCKKYQALVKRAATSFEGCAAESVTFDLLFDARQLTQSLRLQLRPSISEG
jgi:hypothetical protein